MNNNTGRNNTGDRNSGDRNSGDRNSGDRNSGDRNSGYGNSGYGNSGHRNSGYGNSGYGNSGYGNSTNRESGIFNSMEGTVRIFNKDSGKKWEDIDHPHFSEFYLTKWISEDEITAEEKRLYPQQGYLKTYTYKEAWANFWRDTDEKNRQKFLNLPNFDWVIFTEITGITPDTKTDIIELTLEDIAKLKGVDVNKIRIKE